MSNKRNPLFTIAITLIYIAAVLYYILSIISTNLFVKYFTNKFGAGVQAEDMKNHCI